MVIWNYIILGILQGIFEWIPISSEGIVALTSQFLKMEVNPVDTALFLHLGTFFAVMVYFIKDWIKILLFKDRQLLVFLIIATAISLIVALPIYLLMHNTAVGTILLAITGCGLLVTAIFNIKKIHLDISPNRLAFITGFLQGLSVIPGLSRSGSTIFGLSLGKNSPQEILKISYLMSAPVVLAACAYLFWQNPAILPEMWIALLTSFIIGLLCLYVFIKIFSKINFFIFALIFAIICFIGATIGFITG